MAQHLSVRVPWKDNGWTGLVYRDAIEQYKACRSSRELLLSGKERAVVHFAVDTEEVWMAAQLNGADTVFIPFNKGCNGGAGNPAFIYPSCIIRPSFIIKLRFMSRDLRAILYLVIIGCFQFSEKQIRGFNE